MSNNEKLYLQYSFPDPHGKQHCGTRNVGDGGGGLECDSPDIYML